MATSTRGYKRALFDKWADRAKELDEAFYSEWATERDDAFYSQWAVERDEASRKGSPPSCPGCVDLDQGDGGENQLAHMDPGGCMYVDSDEESGPSHSDSNSSSAKDDKNAISTLLTHYTYTQSALQKMRAQRLHSEEKLLEEADKTK